MADGELGQFVSQQIENLRPRLLDLSRRNPLLSTPFSERSHANIRVVDEVPTILFEKLVTGKMRVVPLPPLEEDPRDEQTREFQSALSDARLVDEAYLAALDEIDEDSDEAPQKLINVERELKDRLREVLGLSPRQTSSDLSLAQHARNNFIRPSYELPLRDEQDVDGRHTDNDIQTLLLPDIFERRLNSIGTKCRTWLQETGISVFHVAFGFLEWAEADGAKSSFAPLILMPATIEKERTPRGPEFWISGDENVDNNVVLVEKFRADFNIEFPNYEPGMPVEEYFGIVADAAPPGRKWKVRRQVAVGVFPSARMAMYHDLDPSDWQFGEHQVMLDLLGGNASAGGSPFADDYMVDEPEIEAKVPLLVMDTDSSQFSTIVDAMDGKNLAVEGPPGTGKSQTIVNIIAGSMFAGKRVLFVAEKTAALDIVRSRLEAARLGEFILPLLATRSGRADVIQSVRERIEMTECSDPTELDQKIGQFRRTRAEISEYVTAVSSLFGEIGLTVFDVLGRQISLREELSAWPVKLQRYHWPAVTQITDTRLKELTDLAQDIEQAAQVCKSHPDHWKAVNVRDIDPYQLGEVLEAATQCLESFEHSVEVRGNLNDFGLNEEDREEQLRALHRVIQKLGKNFSADVGRLSKRLLPENALKLAEQFLEQAGTARKEREKLTELCVDPLAENLVEDLQKLAVLLEKIGLPDISTERMSRLTEERQESVDALKAVAQFLEEAISIVPEASDMEPQAIFDICRFAERISREALALRNKDMEN
ncbi:MAG: DUF4011 domain-containing protein, partial [Planctomycetes bacterium]|nr:DUF4011 domain-containing protein [Planctomycetota bacterium]